MNELHPPVLSEALRKVLEPVLDNRRSFAPPTTDKVADTLLPMFYRGKWACWVYPSNRGRANSVQFISRHEEGVRCVNVEIFVNQVRDFDPDAFYASRTR